VGNDGAELELATTTYAQTGQEYYCKVTWNEVEEKTFGGESSKVKLYVRG